MATSGKRESVQAQNVCQVDDEEPQEQPMARLPRGAYQTSQKERGGYECEFVQRPPEVIQTECSICLQVLKEPHMISCCGHNFCKPCIKRVEKDGKSCPLCNEVGFSLMHNKGLERSLRELEVHCTNRKVGCEWVGKLGVLEQHLNVNPELEKQLEGCGIVEAKCVHANCGQFFQRRFLGNHQADECPKRPFSCDYCREYESIFEDVAYNHYPVCKCYPISCPNNCTLYAIERQNLQHHLDEDCPLQVVHCDFQYAGCEAKLPRKDMPAHLAENYSHITLLAVLNQRLAQKNDDMAAKLLEKDEQIERLTEEFRREMQAKQTELYQVLRNEIDELKQDAVLKTDFDLLKKDAVPKANFDRLKQDAQLKKDAVPKADFDQLKQDAQLKKDAVPKADLDVQFGMFKQQNEALKGQVVRLKINAVAKADFNKLKEEVQFKKGAVPKAEFDKLKEEVQYKKGAVPKAEFDKLKEEVQCKKGAVPKSEFDKLKEEVVSQAQLADELREEHKAALHKLHHHIHIAPVQITMSNFKQHKRACDSWYSDPFYTHPRGYKMCLNVEANGHGNGKGTHVSVFVYLMRGDFDNYLKWPFQGEITINLLNQQEDKEHHSDVVPFCHGDKSADRVTNGARASTGRGKLQSISHRDLTLSYLKSDCLVFLVEVQV